MSWLACAHRSVLENRHAAMTFTTLQKPACNVLENLPREEWRQVRSLMLTSILATDMAHHNTMVKDLTSFAVEMKPIPSVEALKTLVHVADLGNCALSWEYSLPWSTRVCDESLAQAREEHRLGLPSPMKQLDALSREEVLARQLVFIDGWIRPLYTAAAVLFPGAKDRLQVLEENREKCKQIVAARNG